MIFQVLIRIIFIMPSVSLPIAPAPMNALFLGILIGISMMCLVVDHADNPTLSQQFYMAKGGAAPLWFKAFNGLVLLVGVTSSIANCVFAVTRSSPPLRKLCDVIGFFVLVGIIYFSVTVVLPSENVASKATAADHQRNHLIVLGLQIVQLVIAFVAFRAQNATKVKKN